MIQQTGRNQDGRFAPGHSGNPAGRPKGARSKRTILRERVMAAETCAGAAEPLEDTIVRFCAVLDKPSRRDLEVVARLFLEVMAAAGKMARP